MADEHHQSHITGPHCEHITQGCGGARERLIPSTLVGRTAGSRTSTPRHFEVVAGFAVIEVSATFEIRVRFIGVRPGVTIRIRAVIYERAWNGLDLIGDARLRMAS